MARDVAPSDDRPMSRPYRSPGASIAAPELHEGFRDPRRVPATDLERFLEDADRLTGIREIQRAMRRAVEPGPGRELLDAGCGIGLETTRLAAAHPQMRVTGVDRNADLLRIAAGRRPQPENVRWLEADLGAMHLPEESVDAIRAERVLMYLPERVLQHVLDALVRLLRPGGRLALFELDYGAAMLAPGPSGDAAAGDAGEMLRAAIPQPLAGRRIPGLLTKI
jgi:SAM-dependent methyltransferase